MLDLNNPEGISRGSFTVSYFDPQQPTSRAHEWNLTFERGILANTVVKMGYVGAHAARLDMFYSYNQAPNNYIWFTREGVPLPTGTYSATARRCFETTSDPMYAYYESNTVWVKLKDGTSQRTSLDTNLTPWRNQFLSGLYGWNQNVSLFKVIPVKEQVAFRLNIDFFNVFNIPGIPKTPSSGSGIIDAQYSGNGARALQFGLRLSW